MSFETVAVKSTDKTEIYQILNEQLPLLLGDERDFIANAANTAALIFHTLPDLNWAGFYFFNGEELVVGPFQGKPACVRIQLGRGVCGAAAEKRETQVVPNVHEFSDHIACDSASNSEIVVPLVKNEKLIGVLDLDSPSFNRFDEQDRIELERAAEIFLKFTDF
ncbi:MAG: GAF domain-containing protein [Acidobacteriota bacterium]|nr:GAF domain-containing protein [Acidobacteriota bacterium]